MEDKNSSFWDAFRFQTLLLKLFCGFEVLWGTLRYFEVLWGTYAYWKMINHCYMALSSFLGLFSVRRDIVARALQWHRFHASQRRTNQQRIELAHYWKINIYFVFSPKNKSFTQSTSVSLYKMKDCPKNKCFLKWQMFVFSEMLLLKRWVFCCEK